MTTKDPEKMREYIRRHAQTLNVREPKDGGRIMDIYRQLPKAYDRYGVITWGDKARGYVYDHRTHSQTLVMPYDEAVEAAHNLNHEEEKETA